MRILLRPICLLAALFVLTAAGTATAPKADTMKGPANAQADPVAKVQLRMGTLMNEYANRFVDVYFAAEGDNWAFAQYQLRELRALQEIGAKIQPANAKLLRTFGDTYLAPLEETVMAKEWSKFDDYYRNAVKGCNDCHAATHRSFIHFQVPARPVEDYIDFMRETDPVVGNDAKK